MDMLQKAFLLMSITNLIKNVLFNQFKLFYIAVSIASKVTVQD